MIGSRKHSLVWRQPAVVKSYYGCIIPIACNISEGVCRRCVQMVLKNKWYALTLRLASGNHEEIALGNRLNHVFLSRAIEWYSKYLCSAFNRRIVCIEIVSGLVCSLYVERRRVADFGKYLVTQLFRQFWQRSNEIGIYLATTLLQLRVCGEQGIEHGYKLRSALM